MARRQGELYVPTMMNKLRKTLFTAMVTAMGFCGLSLAATPADAFVPDCVKNGSTLTCIGVYQGGARGVDFVRVKNPYTIGVYMQSTDATRPICVESAGYLYVEPATRMAGIIVVSGGTWMPGSPVPC